MEKLIVSLLDAERSIHMETHAGLAAVTLAAVSAEPETIGELEAAMGRYVGQPAIESMFGNARPGTASRPVDDGHLIIDLTACLVVADRTGPQIPRIGSVAGCDAHGIYDIWLPYRIPTEWQWFPDWDLWQETAQRLRHERAVRPPLDTRLVLYGKVCDYIARQWVLMAEMPDDPSDSIHDKWLLTSRDDLRGNSPRQVLLAKRAFIDGDIDDQACLWTILQQCPPGLPRQSHAFLYAGFDSTEIMLYHELVIYLLRECGNRTRESPGDAVEDTVRHLEQLQQEWLHTPREDLYDQSPAALIARQRARLPLEVPSSARDEHDDCPLCQMMFDSDSPCLWQPENFQLEARFSTSFYETYEQWHLNRACPEPDGDPENEVIGLGLEPAVSQPESLRPDTIWNCCYTNMDRIDTAPANEAVPLLVFSIGGNLGELFLDLKQADNAPALSPLQQAFSSLREAIRGSDVWAVKSIVNQFGDHLQSVADRHEPLAAKCADMGSKLDLLAERFCELLGETPTSQP